jgi:hypothetical protein
MSIHGWSDAALGVAEPVEPGFLFSLFLPRRGNGTDACASSAPAGAAGGDTA